MAKLVILMLQDGNFDRGFQALVQIRGDNPPTETQIQIPGALPPAPEIPALLDRWRSSFRSLNMARIEAISTQIVRPDPQVAGELADRLNEWLNSGDKKWRRIRDLLLQNSHEQLRILLETEDIHLRRLPWQAWDLFSTGNYKQTDLAFSPRSYQQPQPSFSQSQAVRVLAVFGYAKNLQLELDRQVLEELGDRQANIEILQQPSAEELRHLLRQKNWHVFFFAGHSQSDANGKIGKFKLNEKEWMEIADLKNSLDWAINKNGLQLAIFNSCDGLGLANQLAQLHLPQSIVMREPVPDEVATQFLQEFLRAFANRESFYVSVRYARGALEDAFHHQYPGVSWLPVICQNPAGIPPHWEGWLNPQKSPVNLPVNVDGFPPLTVTREQSDAAIDRAAIARSPLTPKRLIQIGFSLSVISTVSLLASYVWGTSDPWIQTFGDRGWTIEMARGMLLIVGIIYLIGTKFSREAAEVFAFRSPSNDPYEIFNLFRWFVRVFSFAIAILLLDHHLWTGPEELKSLVESTGSDWLNYRLPYLLYLPYSTINFALTVWLFAGGSYAAIEDLLDLRSQSLNLKNKLELINEENVKDDRACQYILDAFKIYCYDVIYLAKRYTSLFSGLATAILFETIASRSVFGQDTLSESAKAWFWVGAIVVAIVLLIIFWGFSHYETVFQQTSHCLSKFQVNYQQFEKENNSFNVLRRISRSNLSMYLGILMFLIAIGLMFWLPV
jgi:hypothetical protein